MRRLFMVASEILLGVRLALLPHAAAISLFSGLDVPLFFPHLPAFTRPLNIDTPKVLSRAIIMDPIMSYKATLNLSLQPDLCSFRPTFLIFYWVIYSFVQNKMHMLPPQKKKENFSMPSIVSNSHCLCHLVLPPLPSTSQHLLMLISKSVTFAPSPSFLQST